MATLSSWLEISHWSVPCPHNLGQHSCGHFVFFSHVKSEQLSKVWQAQCGCLCNCAGFEFYYQWDLFCKPGVGVGGCLLPRPQGIVELTLSLSLFFFDVWSYLFVTLTTSHFLLDSDLEVEALREDSLRLLAICSCCFFFFWPPLSLGQKFSIFCSLFFVFLSTLFLQSNMPALVLQNSWSHETLNLGCFSPRFLTFFV